MPMPPLQLLHLKIYSKTLFATNAQVDVAQILYCVFMITHGVRSHSLVA